MDLLTALNGYVGGNWGKVWLYLFVGTGLVWAIASGYLKARKIQPKGFKWKTFRNEIIFGVLNVTISGYILKLAIEFAVSHNSFIAGPATWWMIALEYGAYFVMFDTWFYWLHRLMHKEPIYKWVHKLHHLSTSTNLATNFSVNPLESFINGGFVPIFLFLIPIHAESMALITPTNVFMGLLIHSGYELFPRWWNKSWATKWFITATFHDQHHKYFNYNFGGYTTVWDRMCGTMRTKYESDFEKITTRNRVERSAVVATSDVVEPQV
jgi:Delta7-sterol 5-desaturase